MIEVHLTSEEFNTVRIALRALVLNSRETDEAVEVEDLASLSQTADFLTTHGPFRRGRGKENV